jgi:hypothetical protein
MSPCRRWGVLAVFLVSVVGSLVQDNPARKDWLQLFNGKDLQDWAAKITGYDLNDNFGDTFRVENGVLKVAYDRYDRFNGRFGHLFYRAEFSYYVVAEGYRFIGQRCPDGPDWAVKNSGLMVHPQSRSVRKLDLIDSL